MYRILTGVTSDFGVPLTYLLLQHYVKFSWVTTCVFMVPECQPVMDCIEDYVIGNTIPDN